MLGMNIIYMKKIKKITRKIVPNFILEWNIERKNRRSLKRFMGQFSDLHIGENVHISRTCVLGKGVKIYDNAFLGDVSIGDYSYIASSGIINETSIGKYCSIGPSVRIGLGNHPSEGIVSTHPSFFSTRRQSGIVYADKNYTCETERIIIGNDVWVGANVLIKDGVNIGNGAIIGAGAVVVKDVASYAIVGGVPAKIIRYRFLPEEIVFLEEFKWWDKEEEWLRENWKKFLDIKEFMVSFKR